MQRRNTSLLIAAVAVAILAAVVWRQAADDPTPASNPDDGPPPATVPGSRSAPPEDPPAAAPFDGPRVVVTAKSREQYVPPRPSRVRAVQLPNRTALPTTMLAGTGANPWSDELRPGVALVAIEADGGRLLRQIGVEATGVAELGLGGVLAVRGRVQDEADQPVVGAHVWFGELDASGAPREQVTGDDGAFEARVRASDGVPLVVRADGYASTWRPIRVDVDTAREHTITLVADGVLAVQLAGQAENVEAARVFVLPSGPRAAELSRYPFFLQAVFGGVAVDGKGRAELRGLPQQGSLRVAVVHPQVVINQHFECALQGTRTACTVQLQCEPLWSASISNDDGGVVADATVLVRPGGRRVLAGSGLKLLPPHLTATGCLYATTDGDGNFVCGKSPADGGVLSLRAPGHAGRNLDLAAVLGGGDTPIEPLWLPMWRGGDLVVRLQPPVVGAPWRAEFSLGGGTVIDCAADEVAVVSLPHFGLFDFVVTTYIGQQKQGEREYRGVSATGTVTLPAPKVR